MPPCTRALVSALRGRCSQSLTSVLSRPAPPKKSTAVHHERSFASRRRPISKRENAPESRRTSLQSKSSSFRLPRAVMDALRETGTWCARPKTVSGAKVDLLHSPSPDRSSRLARRRSSFHHLCRKPSPQDLLAALIRRSASDPDPQLVETLKVAARDLTQKQALHLYRPGYVLEDVRLWYSILNSEDSVEAVRCLQRSLQSDNAMPGPPESKPVPLFVLMSLLRRPRIDPEALRDMLDYLWDRAAREEPHRLATNVGSASSHSISRLADPSTLFLLVLRLIRHARMVLPDALGAIVKLYLHCWQLPTAWNLASSGLSRTITPRLIKMHSALLKQLSLPTSISPYVSSVFQEAAQFDLLGYMAEQQPAIAVDREGYRAIVRVLLARSKTPQERDWAELKKPTWPPWKEDRMGFDSEKTGSYGASRALTALKHARAAGYGDETWESAASILSGWDVDNTPTIQTRAWLLHVAASRSESDTESALWAARIRSTRTAHESWALYLSFRNQQHSLTQDVALALVQKLASEDRRLAIERGEIVVYDPTRTSSVPLLGGDSGQVLAPPSSEREGVYTPSPTPSMHAFTQEMNALGLIPGKKTLALLIRHASSLRRAEKYIAWASTKFPPLRSLLPNHEAGLNDDDDLMRVPDNVFRAYLERYFKDLRLEARSDERSTSFVLRMERLVSFLPLVSHPAMALPPTWHPLMQALTDFDIFNCGSRGSRGADLWRVLLLMRGRMAECGVRDSNETMLMLCRGAQNAILTAKMLEVNSPSTFATDAFSVDVPGTRHFGSAEELARHVGVQVRSKFYEFFGTQNARSLKAVADDEMRKQSLEERGIPRLLARPTAALLNQYICALGLLRAYDRLLELVRWMSVYSDEIEFEAEQTRGGEYRLRRCILSLRLFLDRRWIAVAAAPAPAPPSNVAAAAAAAAAEEEFPETAAPALTRRKIREIVEAHPGWGGWPSEQEMDGMNAERFSRGLRALRFM